MTRQQYMSQLQNQLCFLLPDSEVADILCDMEECFDAGIAEGKTEDEICLSLGSPADAAKEILSERSGSAGVLSSKMGMRYISPLICAALGVLIFFTVDFMTSGALVLVGIILPPLMHVILEQNNFTAALKADKTDIWALSAALLWFGAVLLFRPFSNIMLFANGGAALGLSVKISALIAAPQVFLIISAFKSGRTKLFCIVPAFTAGMVAVSHFLASQNFNAPGYSGTVLNICSVIILLTAAELFFWEILNRNAFSLPMQYIIVFGGIISKFIRLELGRLDPTDRNSLLFMNNTAVIVLAATGTAAALISLAAIIIVRHNPKARPPKQHMEINGAVQ